MLIGLAATWTLQVAAQPWPERAPLEQYLMPSREAEVALARSAAPEAIASGARVLVFDGRTHQEAVAGGNGFTCVVMRGWSGPARKGTPYADFWNPKVRAPICFSPEATKTALVAYLVKTELAVQGRSQDEVLAGADEALGDGRIPVPAHWALAYMMSSRQYLGDNVTHFKPHLMLYLPYATAASWSAGQRVTPGFVGADHGSPLALVIVPVSTWSDGTLADHGGHD
jgi:hypothetical protein